MNIYIARHGETDWNKQGKLQGMTDIPLNTYGVTLAEKTAEGLQRDHISFDRVFSSPLLRAAQTAEILAEASGAEVTVDGRLREMCFGSYQGHFIRDFKKDPAYAQISDCFYAPEKYCAQEDAESFEALFARIGDFLNSLQALEGTWENVLVVGHAMGIRTMLCILKKVPLAKFWSLPLLNCSINMAVLENGVIRLREENRVYYDAPSNGDRRFV